MELLSGLLHYTNLHTYLSITLAPLPLSPARQHVTPALLPSRWVRCQRPGHIKYGSQAQRQVIVFFVPVLLNLETGKSKPLLEIYIVFYVVRSVALAGLQHMQLRIILKPSSM